MFTKVVIFSHIRKTISLPDEGETLKLHFPTDREYDSQPMGTPVPNGWEQEYQALIKTDFCSSASG